MTREDAGGIAGDLSGGFLAALMSVPAAMAYGVLVFGPFGGEAVARGLVAGLVALALSNLASAVAEGEVVCSALAAESLDRLTEESPRVASKVLAGICREIATRLRIANRTAR